MDITSSRTLSTIQSAPADTAVEHGGKDNNVHPTKDDDAKLLFGNGKLDRWLSARRALHGQPKLQTLDQWLSPNKMPAASLSKKSPSVARTRVASPDKSLGRHSKSPSKPRLKSSAMNNKLESLDSPQSPSTDIRRFFRNQGLPHMPPSTSDSGTKDELRDDVTVVDLVDSSAPEVKTEHRSEAVDQVKSFHGTVAAPPEAAVKFPSCQQNFNDSPVRTVRSLEWWATSRTKLSTRKGPFKRSLGLVHFLNEVCFMPIHPLRHYVFESFESAVHLQKFVSTHYLKTKCG